VTFATWDWDKQQWKYQPVGRAKLTVKLLDLGGEEESKKGALKYKASVDTRGVRKQGFEIDRLFPLFSSKWTRLFGNVTYHTSNVPHEWRWKSESTFGIDQAAKLLGVKFSIRVGLTPEGQAKCYLLL